MTDAQDWPNKPINLYIGLPAGSGVDVVARMLQRRSGSRSERLVIDHKSGAGGNVASELAAGNVTGTHLAFGAPVEVALPRVGYLGILCEGLSMCSLDLRLAERTS